VVKRFGTRGNRSREFSVRRGSLLYNGAGVEPKGCNNRTETSGRGAVRHCETIEGGHPQTVSEKNRNLMVTTPGPGTLPPPAKFSIRAHQKIGRAYKGKRGEGWGPRWEKPSEKRPVRKSKTRGQPISPDEKVEAGSLAGKACENLQKDGAVAKGSRGKKPKREGQTCPWGARRQANGQQTSRPTPSERRNPLGKSRHTPPNGPL